MQASLKLLYSAAAALSLMAMQAPATAGPVASEHGAVCKPYNYSNAGGLYSWVLGVSNYTNATMAVICPIVRPAEVVDGRFDVWVSQRAGSPASTCWLYSYNWTSAFLGVSGPITGQGWLGLAQAAVPAYSYQAVYCLLPPNGNILGVSPVL
ncbi:hypothetical protein [Azohydromonas caseinilytica]|uniref:Secreted protein n=1 Tax=Azohydromonas caseinilytica TaxID=2728836 RepID=A0A848FBB1_9BURK|nr:hypothetical protein [Azohydromonas caseinilytica]NML15480.1 hypothetical protein [Azohydromonas caseinilytica]